LSDNTSSLTVGTLDNSAGGTVNLAGGVGVVDQVILPSGTIGGGLGGPGGLTKVGPGVLTYAGVSLNTGPMRVQGGKVVIAPTVALNDAIAVTVDAGATLEYTAGTADTIFSLNSAGTVVMNRDLSIGGATIPAANGGSGSISGSLQGTGGLQKRGPGTLTISGSATHTGATLIENGSVILTGSLGGTSSISITDGPLTGGGTLTINGGQVTTPGVLASRTASSTLVLNGGSITTGKLDLSGTFESSSYLSTFTWTAGTIHITDTNGIQLNNGTASAADKPFRSTLTLNPTRTLIVDGPLTVGTGGTLNLSGGRLALGSSSFSTNQGTFNFNSGTLEFLGFAPVDSNFLGNSHSSPLTAGKVLKINGQVFLQEFFELDGGTLSAGSFFNAHLLRLQGGTLNVTNTLSIDAGKALDVARGVIVNAGRLSVGSNGQLNAIGAAITTTAASSNLGQINAIGSTITLVGGLSGSGQVNLINTILNSSTPIEAGAITSSGATHLRSVSSGNVSVNSGSLTLDLNSGPSVFDALSISSGSALNLTNNTLIVRTGSAQDINDLIRFGLNSSTGLIANLTAPNQRLGAMVNGESGLPLYSTFDGINLAGGEILIRKTIIGDVNLDGQVSIADFIELASNFGRTAATWEEGDVNYDQQVTISDFIELASNFNMTFAGEALAAGDLKAAVLADFYASHVPEPGALASAMAGLLLCRRRWGRGRW
jgi:autotransporter-associated beta strand protein